MLNVGECLNMPLGCKLTNLSNLYKTTNIISNIEMKALNTFMTKFTITTIMDKSSQTL
jgi:hypothetical protein